MLAYFDINHLVNPNIAGIILFTATAHRWICGDLMWMLTIAHKLSQVAKATRRVSQNAVLGPILYVVYVNYLADNPTIDHGLHAWDAVAWPHALARFSVTARWLGSATRLQPMIERLSD